jgi:hypothetical protein
LSGSINADYGIFIGWPQRTVFWTFPLSLAPCFSEVAPGGSEIGKPFQQLGEAVETAIMLSAIVLSPR